MSSLYSIEVRSCDFCYVEASNQMREHFKTSHPDYDSTNPEHRAAWKVYWDNWTEPEPQPCFYFIADCGGDAISICARHLEKILAELVNYVEEDQDAR
ncbi:MAG: hypothetical protein A2W25_12150 [candidate division Zixibacteria bacterium RBG_16_53_22]|nr:MAG: hypothetical protein A2W25_12150 [candidate division Zixibacteria bacterium RBG_16_53_22]